MITLKTNIMKYKDSDGKMQSLSVAAEKKITDISLTQNGIPADAKATGDELSRLQEEIDDQQTKLDEYETLTLGVHTDGRIYIFKNGSPKGNGLEIKAEEIAGDVIGYIDENKNIVLSGALAEDIYNIKYEMEDGTLVDIGKLSLVEAVEIINQIPISTDTDGTIFNSTGYMENRRIGSAYTVSTLANGNATKPVFITGFIPVKEGDRVYLKNCYIDSNTITDNSIYGEATGSIRVGIYNSSKTKVGQQSNDWARLGNNVTSPSPYCTSFITDENGHTTSFIIKTGLGIDLSFIRLTLAPKDGYTPADAIVTVNQEI